MTTELICLDNINAVTAFSSGGMDSILNSIRAEISSEVPDTSTDRGRKAIASNAHRASRAKVIIDNLGKKLTDDLNARLKPINAERKKARDELDQIRDDTRQPLTDWETAQAEIKAAEEAQIAAEKLAERVDADHELGLLLNDKFDAEVKIKKAQADKDRKDRDDLLQKEAAEKATIEAEQKAEADILKAEEEKNAAVLQAALAEQKAETDKQTAVQAEKQRQVDKEQKEKDDLAAREADVAHISNIRRQAKESLMATGLSEDVAKKIVMQIHAGAVANVTINY